MLDTVLQTKQDVWLLTHFWESNDSTCVFLTGDFNANLSDSNSIFEKHLLQVINDSNLILPRKYSLLGIVLLVLVMLVTKLCGWMIVYAQQMLMPGQCRDKIWDGHLSHNSCNINKC